MPKIKLLNVEGISAGAGQVGDVIEVSEVRARRWIEADKAALVVEEPAPATITAPVVKDGGTVEVAEGPPLAHDIAGAHDPANVTMPGPNPPARQTSEVTLPKSKRR